MILLVAFFPLGATFAPARWVHTPDRTKASMRAYIWDRMKDWLLHGAIEAAEKTAADLAERQELAMFLRGLRPVEDSRPAWPPIGGTPTGRIPKS